MKILVDMSNLAIDSLQSAFAGSKNNVIDEQSIRHIVLKRLSELHKKLGRHHPMILCFDSRNYWRKDHFPYYKANRKKVDGSFSWEQYYEHYSKLKEELPLYFPYQCIEVARCEADDVINCLSDILNGEVIIASSDTDDLQILERYPHNAKQYSLKHNKFIDCEMYNYNLREHIIEGDFSDCIPSILSDADTYINPDKRSKPLTKKRRSQCKYIVPEEYMARFKENELIIDMSKIPDNYRQDIINEYNKESPKKLGNALMYCIKYKLNNLFKYL